MLLKRKNEYITSSTLTTLNMEKNRACPSKQEIVIYKRSSAKNIKHDITDQAVYEQQQVSRECFSLQTYISGLMTVLPTFLTI